MWRIQPLSALLGVCSTTLNKLDLYLVETQHYRMYTYPTGEIEDNEPSVALSPIPPSLQQLTIRAGVESMSGHDPKYFFISWLPAAEEIIHIFISSLQHLVLDIWVDISPSAFLDLTKIDFSPLAILGPASLSVPRIDLYVHTSRTPSAPVRDHLLSFLEDYEDIVRSIKDGVLVLHFDKIAPNSV